MISIPDAIEAVTKASGIGKNVLAYLKDLQLERGPNAHLNQLDLNHLRHLSPPALSAILARQEKPKS
jgi:hypothetical protein